jgi:putative heme degradation protein
MTVGTSRDPIIAGSLCRGSNDRRPIPAAAAGQAEALARAWLRLNACADPLPDERAHAGDLGALETLGPVLAVTENIAVRQEGRISYRGIRRTGTRATMHQAALALQMDLHAVASVFAVTEMRHARVRESLRFYDGRGTRLHRIDYTQASNDGAWRSLIRRLCHPDQRPGLLSAMAPRGFGDARTAPPAEPRHGPGQRPLEAPPSTWRRYPAGAGPRTPEQAWSVDREALDWLIRASHEHDLRVAVRVCQGGWSQSHTGRLAPPRDPAGPIRLRDRHVRLQLQDTDGATMRIAQRGTHCGVTHTLEILDQRGRLAAELFADHPDSDAEPAGWTRLAQSLRSSARPTGVSAALATPIDPVIRQEPG